MKLKQWLAQYEQLVLLDSGQTAWGNGLSPYFLGAAGLAVLIALMMDVWLWSLGLFLCGALAALFYWMQFRLVLRAHLKTLREAELEQVGIFLRPFAPEAQWEGGDQATEDAFAIPDWLADTAFVAIDNPRLPARSRGLPRLRVPDALWKQAVGELVGRCRACVLDLSIVNANMLFELERVVERAARATADEPFAAVVILPSDQQGAEAAWNVIHRGDVGSAAIQSPSMAHAILVSEAGVSVLSKGSSIEDGLLLGLGVGDGADAGAPPSGPTRVLAMLRLAWRSGVAAVTVYLATLFGAAVLGADGWLGVIVALALAQITACLTMIYPGTVLADLKDQAEYRRWMAVLPVGSVALACFIVVAWWTVRMRLLEPMTEGTDTRIWLLMGVLALVVGMVGHMVAGRITRDLRALE